MHYNAPENTGQITLKMLQDAYAESVKPYEHWPMVFFCKPNEYLPLKEFLDKLFGE